MFLFVPGTYAELHFPMCTVLWKKMNCHSILLHFQRVSESISSLPWLESWFPLSPVLHLGQFWAYSYFPLVFKCCFWVPKLFLQDGMAFIEFAWFLWWHLISWYKSLQVVSCKGFSECFTLTLLVVSLTIN